MIDNKNIFKKIFIIESNLRIIKKFNPTTIKEKIRKKKIIGWYIENKYICFLLIIILEKHTPTIIIDKKIDMKKPNNGFSK